LSGRPHELDHAKYDRPSTTAQALELLHEPGARAWAGGTDLMLEVERGQRTFARCVDVSRLDELHGITESADGVRIGALVTLEELVRATEPESSLLLIGEIAQVMCTVQTRTLATVGGNLCTASPAADLAPPLMALGARVELRSVHGGRTLAVEDLFAGPKRTVMADDELLVAVRVPSRPGVGVGFGRVARTTVDIALAHAAACIELDAAGAIGDARVALCSVAPTPVRARTVEDRLVGLRPHGSATEIERAARATAQDVAPIDDVRASAAYRREVSCVLVKRAVHMALGRIDRAEGSAWAA